MHRTVRERILKRANLDERSKNQLLYKLNNSETIARINRAINDILKKHRNTKIFLIFMGKWFFIGFLLFKYIIKGLVLYIIYKKR